jgi:hypothetical protein
LSVNTTQSSLPQVLLDRSAQLLMVVVWTSSLLFGLYILAFYGAAFFADPEVWNQNLNGLFVRGNSAATSGIGVHFLGGGIILALGCIQLLPIVRTRVPAVHRFVGRVYLLSCLAASIGGTAFVLLSGTIGGFYMDIGFGLYGVLMFVCTVQTFRHAIASNISVHRRWALRLFALAIGSWLYRMDYGIWYELTGLVGHTDTFDGWFDNVMSFFFFIPNLFVVEMFIRGQQPTAGDLQKSACALLLFVATGVVALGTYSFTALYWGPAILAIFS